MSVDYRPDYDPADVNSDYGHTGGDITVPTFTGDTRPFRFWCQKALPLVYDDSLSYYEVLCKMADYLNNFMTDLTTVENTMTEFGQQFVINQQFLNSMADQLGQNVADLEEYINDRMTDFMGAYTQLQSYVNNYFDNLDVQQEINNKLDAMASDGTLNNLFDPVLETWMQQKTAQIDNAIAGQNAIQAQQNSRISVLEGRMDTFSGLPSGSTSGNAELLDIRTNFLGETYPTAGDAVRASDMIASGFQSISATKLEEWDGNDDSSVYDTIQIDISGYKGGHVVVIGSFKSFQSDLNDWGTCSVYATNTPGKVEDANAVNYAPFDSNSIFKSFTQLTTSISGEERLLMQFAIPDNFAYQYLKIGHLEHGILPESYTEPLYIVYANSWSKTQVDPTLTIAGAAADAKATGDAVTELNERLLPIDNMLIGYNKRYSGADIYRTAYDLTIGKKYRITNNKSNNCSFAIFDSSDNIVHNYGAIVANSSITIDASYTGATMGGYSSGGYDISIEVIDDTDLLPYKVEENKNILVKESVSIPFEIGGYNVTTGAPVSITYAIRSALPKNVQFLDCDRQYYYELFVYDGEIGVSDNFIGIYQGDGTISGTNTRLSGLTDLMPLLVTDYNIAIMAGRKDNQTITTDFAENIEANNGCVLSAFNSLKTAPCYNSSPNIIYQCRNVDSTKYPPYTKYYIKSAADNQYDRVRLNVRKTTDGYYFLCHDDTINSEARNSDGSTISSPVSANGRTLAELNSYDWGIKYGSQYAGLGAPMLEDALFYSALYNLGVTIEISSIDGWTSTDSQNIVNMFNKYGVSDDLILIDPSGFSIGFLANFVPLNPKISYYLGTTPSVLDTAVINRINTELKTDFNKIYITEFPFGTYASDNMIKIANDNGWILYNSFTMSLSDLLDDDNFNHGYRIIEANNVRNVKDTVRAWANSKVND